MRSIILIVAVAGILFSCNSDDDDRDRNTNLLNVNFSITLSNIQSLDLQIPGNAVFAVNGGLRGVFVVNTGSGILAWEAADPNSPLSDCSRMDLDGIEVTSNCVEGRRYNLFTGQAEDEVLEFTMLSYRVSNNGGSITVSN